MWIHIINEGFQENNETNSIREIEWVEQARWVRDVWDGKIEAQQLSSSMDSIALYSVNVVYGTEMINALLLGRRKDIE